MELTTTIKSNQMMENGVNIFTNYYLQAPALILSKIDYTESFGGTAIGSGHINPRLHLDLIHSPGSYGLSFYGTESFKSNEIRDYTTGLLFLHLQ